MGYKRIRFGPEGAAALLMILWGLFVFRVWDLTGLFNWIGIDYALLTTSAKLLVSDRPESAYDLQAVARQIEPLHAYYRPQGALLRCRPRPASAPDVSPLPAVHGGSPRTGDTCSGSC